MPDGQRPVRRSSKTVPHAAQSTAANGGSRSVVGALLRGQPELALLQKAAAGLATLDLVDDRYTLLSRIAATRPGAVVLPPYDSNHMTTAPLVLRVRREAPSVAVLVISNHPRGAGQPILRAVKAGAHVIAAPTAATLHAALTSLLEPKGVGP